MYGDVLSYPVEDAGVAMRSKITSRAPFVRTAPRAPLNLAARFIGRSPAFAIGEAPDKPGG